MRKLEKTDFFSYKVTDPKQTKLGPADIVVSCKPTHGLCLIRTLLTVDNLITFVDYYIILVEGHPRTTNCLLSNRRCVTSRHMSLRLQGSIPRDGRKISGRPR